MLGFAWQKGMIPLSAAAIERAIELNQVSIEANKTSFAWGRRAAVDPDGVAKAAAPATPVRIVPLIRKKSVDLNDVIATREAFLTAYQSKRYARRYSALVARVQAAERARIGEGSSRLTEAVARYFFKLMAYKDEYEVARLYTDGAFEQRLAAQFEGDYKLVFNLAPPLLARRNPKGELVKQEFGPWMFKAFRLLARLRRLRGTPLDPFGRTAERRTERRLIDDYEALIDRLVAGLDEQRLGVAVAACQPAGADPRIRAREGATPEGGPCASGRAAGASTRARRRWLAPLDRAERPSCNRLSEQHGRRRARRHVPCLLR